MANSGVAGVTYTLKTVYAVGDAGPAGGVVFYDKGSYSDGWRYLEAAPSDEPGTFVWGGYGTVIGNTSVQFGTGKANTAAIVAKLGGGGYAAKVCSDKVLNGYSDWFLPSKEELYLMYQQRSVIGGFSAPSPIYWNSTEYDSDLAFCNGYHGTDYKNHYQMVRAIRAF